MDFSRIAAGAVFLTTALALAGCGEDSPSSTVVGDDISIVGTEMAFTPETLTATVGRHKVSFTNDGGVHHELAVIAPDGEVLGTRSIPAGDTATFDVELDEPGTYELLCREPGHTEAGMVGTLTVTR